MQKISKEPRIPSSPIPPLSSTVKQIGSVSSLTEQFEMNTHKQWVDDSSPRSADGNRWTPKGGPKAQELPQLLPTVEFKTTPSGGKYRKINYEVVDAEKLPRSDIQEVSPTSQYNFERSREESTVETSTQRRFVSPTRQKDQITVYEYDSGEISRRTEEMPVKRSSYDQRILQKSVPTRREWSEERKREVWSSTSKGVWHYPSSGGQPSPTTPSFEQWSRDGSRYRSDTAQEERSSIDIGSVPSSRVTVRQDQDGRISASGTWNTRRKDTSYSTASTLQKTRELDEEIVVSNVLFSRKQKSRLFSQ
ncbi:unnamed protein product [Thelazia callipaeda]|uniref:Inactive rhomboid protein 2 n=1 Tax=Thelazia callipaeda TaxID=103827 RepID=A0A0N5CXW3_THECL|nr:unnamed protein product [Thelazia callipaeda]